MAHHVLKYEKSRSIDMIEGKSVMSTDLIINLAQDLDQCPNFKNIPASKICSIHLHAKIK